MILLSTIVFFSNAACYYSLVPMSLEIRLRPSSLFRYKQLSRSSSSFCLKKVDIEEESDDNDGETNNQIRGIWIPDSFTKALRKNLSLPSIFAGSIIGAFGILFVLFSPILRFESNEIQYNIDRNINRNTAYEADIKETSTNSQAAITKSVSQFSDILNTLRIGYIDEVDQNKLFETAVGEMLKTLDPYTEYENIKDSQQIQESVAGRYAGVGLVISNNINANGFTDSTTSKLNQKLKKNKNGVTVVGSFEGYAYDAGMRVGDRLLRVDGKDISRMGVDEVRSLLRGVPDTEVKVTFERDEPAVTNLGGNVNERHAIKGKPGTFVHTAVLLRQSVQISDIRLATFIGPETDGIGYINLAGFNAGAGRDFRTAFNMLKYSALKPTGGEGLKGLILDLRGNPGGLLDAAVEIASYLVPPGSDIVTSKTRGGPELVYRSTADPMRPENMKLVVLVNEGSASASEIVSGAVQDLDAGVIMGQDRTYGKGLVQKITPLKYYAALKYTVAKYYTPSGRCIQAVNYSGGREDKGKQLNSMPKIIDVISNPANEDVKEEGEGESEGDEEEEEIMMTLQDRADGASTVKDSERKQFYTKSGRSIRDGGGIEPDIKTMKNELSIIEKIFIAKGIYTDYSKGYVKTHQVSPFLKRKVLQEIENRNADERYANGFFGNQMARYLVLQGNERGPIQSYKNSKVAFGHTTHTDLYNDFKLYVQQKVEKSELDLSVPDVDSSITALSKALKANSLDDSYLEKIIKPSISKTIISQMDQDKDAITDGLEFNLFSRELPDRLLLWRAVQDDQQVIAGADVIRTSVALQNKRLKALNHLESDDIYPDNTPLLTSYGMINAPPEFMSNSPYDNALRP